MYLEGGRCSFANNLARIAFVHSQGERTGIHRHTGGVTSSAVMYLITETAKTNKVHLYHYLTVLLEKLPTLDKSDEVIKYEIEECIKEDNK